jgi:hypothetical protein
VTHAPRKTLPTTAAAAVSMVPEGENGWMRPAALPEFAAEDAAEARLPAADVAAEARLPPTEVASDATLPALEVATV